MTDKPIIISAALLATGIFLGAFFVAGSLGDRGLSRVVTVKGLVEKSMRADSVTWPITFIASGNELPEVYTQVTAAQKKITDFLLANGLVSDDMNAQQWRVVDQNAAEYGNSTGKDRFIIYAGVQVSTDKIDKVLELTSRTAELIAQGVVLSNSTASFRFNSLNSIKPELLAEATKNARSSAEQFAKDSGSKVGDIARANQGVISILSKGADYDDAANPEKVVRVVTTIDYYLKD